MKTKINAKNNKTLKRKTNKKTLSYSDKHIVSMFLLMLNTVKLYHWKTSSYAEHKATDELYANLNANIDAFVEVMLGKNGSRTNLTGQKTLPLLDYTNVSDFKREIDTFKKYLIGMNNDSNLNVSGNTDLMNIRDEILSNLNQFSYLLTFK